MDLPNPDGPNTWNAKYRSVESAIRKLGISQEEAAELQGYIKRLLDEDKAVSKGYPIESLLIHRYQTDWKHLRIWQQEPVINVEPAFKKCLEAVRDGLNLPKFSISSCPPPNHSSTAIKSSPARQACLGYSSGSESTSTAQSRGSSFTRGHRYDIVSSKTATPVCRQDNYWEEFDNLPFRGTSPEGPLYIRHHSRPTGNHKGWKSAPRSKSSAIKTPSFYGGSDPGPSSRGRKYPPIVERQHSLPLAHPRSRSSSSSRATSPILPSDFAVPLYSPTAPYQPNKTTQDFSSLHNPDISDPTRNFTFTEHLKSESYRSWYPKPHPVSRSTPSFVLPASSYSEGLIPTMDTTIPTTPHRRVPSRKPVPPARTPSSSNGIIPAPLNLTQTTRATRRMSDSIANYPHQNPHNSRENYYPQRHDPKPTPPALSPHHSTTLLDLSINKNKQTHNPHCDLVDELCLGKKRDMTPDFEIVPVTRLLPHSQSSENQHRQGHRRAREKPRSRVDERGTRNRQSDGGEGTQEGGSWRKLVCGCCGDEH